MNPILKYIVGAATRHLLTALFTLIIVRHYIGADIAAKLMHGDTLTLYNGYTLSFKSIADYLALVAIPALIPIGLSLWTRIKAKFKILTALHSTIPMEVTEKVDNASPVQIIKTVAASPNI